MIRERERKGIVALLYGIEREEVRNIWPKGKSDNDLEESVIGRLEEFVL